VPFLPLDPILAVGGTLADSGKLVLRPRILRPSGLAKDRVSAALIVAVYQRRDLADLVGAEDLYAMLAKQGGRHAFACVASSGETAVIDEAAAAGRATVGQQGKTATLPHRQFERCAGAGDVGGGDVFAARLDDGSRSAQDRRSAFFAGDLCGRAGCWKTGQQLRADGDNATFLHPTIE